MSVEFVTFRMASLKVIDVDDLDDDVDEPFVSSSKKVWTIQDRAFDVIVLDDDDDTFELIVVDVDDDNFNAAPRILDLTAELSSSSSAAASTSSECFGVGLPPLSGKA